MCKWLATIPKWNGIRTEKKLYQRCRHGVVDAIKRGSVVARTHCISMRVWRVCVSFCHASKPFHILFGRFFFSSFGFCHSGYLSFLLHADTRTRIETTHNDTFDALFLSIKWQCFVDCFFFHFYVFMLCRVDTVDRPHFSRMNIAFSSIPFSLLFRINSNPLCSSVVACRC